MLPWLPHLRNLLILIWLHEHCWQTWFFFEIFIGYFLLCVFLFVFFSSSYFAIDLTVWFHGIVNASDVISLCFLFVIWVRFFIWDALLYRFYEQVHWISPLPHSQHRIKISSFTKNHHSLFAWHSPVLFCSLFNVYVCTQHKYYYIHIKRKLLQIKRMENQRTMFLFDMIKWKRGWIAFNINVKWQTYTKSYITQRICVITSVITIPVYTLSIFYVYFDMKRCRSRTIGYSIKYHWNHTTFFFSKLPKIPAALHSRMLMLFIQTLS